MNQIKAGAILSYISIFLTFAVGLIYTPILIRWLGQSDYGIYSIVLSFAAYLSIMDMGIGNAIVRYIARNKEIGNVETESALIGQFLKFFTVISLLTLVIGNIICLKTPDIFRNSLAQSDIQTIQIMVVILTVNLAISFPLSVYTAVLQAYEKFIFIKVSAIVRVILVPLITILSLVLGGRLISMAVIIMAVNISILFVGFIYCKKQLKVKASFTPIDRDLRKEIVVYAFLIFLTSIADKIYWQTDQILLGIFKSAEVVSVYAIAVQFVMIFISLSIVLSSLFLPKISKLVTVPNHLPQLNEIFISVSRIQFYVLALAFSGFVIFGKEFIMLWAGSKYELAYWLVIILMLPFFFELIQNVGLIILQAKGLNLFRTVSLIVCSILNIIISIPIINLYGSIGTAVITAIFVATGNVLLLNGYYYWKLNLDIKRYWLTITRISIPIILLSVGYYYVKKFFVYEYNVLILWILGYILVYSLMTYFLLMNSKEKNMIKKIINRR